ncbi:MAG: kefC [Gemmataceae bacterium]|nr:kefC [Gemmataceae bacterium]
MGPATESRNPADRPVVLCGLGRVGWRVLEWLRAAGQAVAVVDTDPPADDPRLAGLTVVKGDCRRQEVLERAGVKNARGVLIVTSDDLVNVSAALLVRRLNPDARVVVRMFNQNLLARLGAAVKNTVALSVSALTAPMLALTAATGEALGAFKLDAGPQQVSELVVAEGSDLAGRTVADVCGQYRLLPLALTTAAGKPTLLLDVAGDSRLSVGDRLVIAGAPHDLRLLIEGGQGGLLPGVLWAGAVRRWVRTIRRTLWEVDLSVKIATPILFVTLLASTLIFRFGLDTSWADGLYQTVTIVATGSELHGENRPEWIKVFLSVLKLAGAALIAGFTAILTNYLIRARLGGALEVRRVPDGGHVVVCGLGNIGYRCVEELTAIGERVVAIDRMNDNPFNATCRRKGVPTFVGDATVAEVLRQARADSAKAVIAATPSELANLEIALLVREMNPGGRVIVRLSDPQFAEAVREAAAVRYAVSVPALAAPAFAAALFGDRVQTLIAAAGRTLVVVEFAVHEDDPCLNGTSLRAAVVDYRFLPVALNGHDPSTVAGQRLKTGDRLTAVAELPVLERLLRREPATRDQAVLIDGYPFTAKDGLLTLLRTARRCSQAEAEQLISGMPFVVAEGLTRGEAEELHAKLTRERVTARVTSG